MSFQIFPYQGLGRSVNTQQIQGRAGTGVAVFNENINIQQNEWPQPKDNKMSRDIIKLAVNVL